MKKIIYTGAFRFPDGDAAATRVLGIGKALSASGYEVEFAGWEEHERQQDRQASGHYVFHGFRYKSQRDLRNKKLSPLMRLWHYLFIGNNTLKWLNSTDLSGVAAIIVYQGTSIFLLRLLYFCRLRKINLIIDCTEWHDSKDLVGGRWGIVNFDNEIRMKFVNTLIGNLIVISKYLENYYKKKNCNVILLPPLLDVSDNDRAYTPQIEQNKTGTIKLAFVGSPLRERWDVILRGMQILKETGFNISLEIFGSSKESFRSVLGSSNSLLDRLGETVIVHGRLPKNEYINALASVDFAILIRSTARWSMSCFPSKVPELLSLGIPILLYSTSDLNEYLEDGKNAVFLTEISTDNFVETVIKTCNMPRHMLEDMKTYARKTAIEFFDYRKYLNSINLTDFE